MYGNPQYAGGSALMRGSYGDLSIDILNKAKLALNPEGLSESDLRKNIVLATNLNAYDLQAPAKNLYPTITPLRNSVPRIGRTNPGDAARWRSIYSTTGSGYDSMGWIPEGQRSASMSYQALSLTAPYLTLGEEDTLSFEAEAASVGFEDTNATLTMRLLQKMMTKEESAILGGNASVALGTTPTPSLSATGTTGTLPALTYSVICVALTYEGFRNSAVGTAPIGVASTITVNGNDGNTYVLNGGSAAKSASATQAVTSGQSLNATCTGAPQGTYAYAWYVGAVGAETLQAITGINSISISAPLLAGTQAATALVAGDHSRNQSLAFDGFLNIAANPANNAYYVAMPPGTAGTGTTLTPSSRGSVNEIDQMLITMWNNYRLSPTVIYVHAQQQKDITSKVLNSASGPLLRYNVAGDQSADPAPYEIAANGVVRWYYNPYSVDTGFYIPIRVHPNMPQGTLMGYCERLPMWYQNNETENPFAMMIRRDYYRIDWPIRTRRREYGVYAEETLAAYAPFGVGVITNIANG